MEHAIILSILICSITERAEKLKRLTDELSTQAHENYFPKVEVLTEIDNRVMSIGDKRQKLLLRAIGEYVAFVDDDDFVSEDYVTKILNAIDLKPGCDCVGIEGVIIAERERRLFCHSIQYAGWYQSDGIFYRTPNHLNPIRRELALKVGFANMSFGEDTTYSKRIRKYLRTEGNTEGPIYLYDYTFDNHPEVYEHASGD